jgi:hypothetical protein
VNTLIIEADEDTTPNVVLNHQKNIFSIEGWSHPEDAISFYRPILNWLLDYSKMVGGDMDFHFYFQYFNTASAKQIFNICSLLDEIAKRHKVLIYWHYDKEDIDMRLSGERFAKLLSVPFEYVEKMDAI